MIVGLYGFATGAALIMLGRHRGYFHITATVSEELREVLPANRRDGYALLMKAAAEAIAELARDSRHAGGIVGLHAALHTCTQHPLYQARTHHSCHQRLPARDGPDPWPFRRGV